jgi:hypothetical protein
MNSKKCPTSIMALAFLYAATGIVGFIKNLHAFGMPDFWWIEATEIIAVIAGVYLFFGKNWARWLALAWMAFHVAISFHPPLTFAIHLVIFTLICGVLLLPASRQYFRTD